MSSVANTLESWDIGVGLITNDNALALNLKKQFETWQQKPRKGTGGVLESKVLAHDESKKQQNSSVKSVLANCQRLQKITKIPLEALFFSIARSMLYQLPSSRKKSLFPEVLGTILERLSKNNVEGLIQEIDDNLKQLGGKGYSKTMKENNYFEDPKCLRFVSEWLVQTGVRDARCRTLSSSELKTIRDAPNEKRKYITCLVTFSSMFLDKKRGPPPQGCFYMSPQMDKDTFQQYVEAVLESGEHQKKIKKAGYSNKDMSIEDMVKHGLPMHTKITLKLFGQS